jgi:transcriptional regulator with XRE-family HTH domain
MVAMSRHDLNSRVGSLLRASRARRRLSQERLAEGAGTSQQWLSRVERGAVNLKLGDAERLFGVLDLRLAITTAARSDEPDVDPDLVADGDVTEALSLAVGMYGLVWRRFAGVPYCIAGRLAALAQGLPVRPLRLDLVVAEADVPAANAAMELLNVRRWSERHQDYLAFGNDLDDGGPRQWSVAGLYELRIEVVSEAPASLSIMAGDRSLPVVPLADLLGTDEDVAELAHRLGE